MAKIMGTLVLEGMNELGYIVTESPKESPAYQIPNRQTCRVADPGFDLLTLRRRGESPETLPLFPPQGAGHGPCDQHDIVSQQQQRQSKTLGACKTQRRELRPCKCHQYNPQCATPDEDACLNGSKERGFSTSDHHAHEVRQRCHSRCLIGQGGEHDGHLAGVCGRHGEIEKCQFGPYGRQGEQDDKQQPVAMPA